MTNLAPLLKAACASCVDGRFYPNVVPEGADLPHAVFHQYLNEPINDLAGWSLWDREQWQVDVYAETYNDARARAAAIRAAITGASTFTATCDLTQDLYENEVRQHRVLMLFTVLHA